MARTPFRDTARVLVLRLIETPLRFPLPLACAAAGTLAMIADIHDNAYDELLNRCQLLAIIGFFLCVAAKSFAECRAWPAWKGIALGLGGLTLAALKVFVDTPGIHQASAAIVFLIPCAILLATVAPFLGRGDDNDFWAFNRTAWLSGTFSGAGALVLFLGILAGLAATEYLFRVNIPRRFFGDSAAVSFGFVWPWLLLSGMPRNYRAGDAAGLKWIERLSVFILVPLAIIYLLILYAYVLRVVTLWELPRGRVAYIVAECAAYGAAVHLITFGFRERGAPLLRHFHRLFYPVLLVPVALMAVGIVTRIGAYGVTEGRYAVAALALWLFAMSALHLAPVKRRLVWVPASLAALAILASFGPWGAESVSLSQQMARLETTLARNGILADGRIRPAATRLDGKDAKDISSIVRYLQTTGRRGALAPLYSSGAIAFDPKKPAQTLVEALDVRYYNRWDIPAKERFYLSNSALRGISLGYNIKKAVIDVAPFRDLAFINFYIVGGKDSTVYLANAKRRLRIVLDADRGTLNIQDMQVNKRVTVELVPRIREWRKKLRGKCASQLWEDMRIDVRGGRLRLLILPANVSGKIVGGKYRVTSLQAIVLIGETR